MNGCFDPQRPIETSQATTASYRPEQNQDGKFFPHALRSRRIDLRLITVGAILRSNSQHLLYSSLPISSRSRPFTDSGRSLVFGISVRSFGEHRLQKFFRFLVSLLCEAEKFLAGLLGGKFCDRWLRVRVADLSHRSPMARPGITCPTQGRTGFRNHFRNRKFVTKTVKERKPPLRSPKRL